MNRHKMVTRFATGAAAAALAFGAVACESEGGDSLDPGQEAPEGDLGGEGGGDLGGEGGGEGDLGGEGGGEGDF